jgi:hypothetical protein
MLALNRIFIATVCASLSKRQNNENKNAVRSVSDQCERGPKIWMFFVLDKTELGNS